MINLNIFLESFLEAKNWKVNNENIKSTLCLLNNQHISDNKIELEGQLNKINEDIGCISQLNISDSSCLSFEVNTISESTKSNKNEANSNTGTKSSNITNCRQSSEMASNEESFKIPKTVSSWQLE